MVINKPTSAALKMNPNFETQIHLVDRKTGQILKKKFYTDPQFTFHHINAYEINEKDPSKHELFIDLCSYSPKGFEIDSFNYDESDEEQILKFNQKAKATPRRIRVPLFDKRSDNEKIYCEIKDIASNVNLELPTINYAKFNAKPYNYAYGIGSIRDPYSIVKINVNNYNDGKQAIIKTGNRVILPSEPIFVEKPNATSEDDGVVLTQVIGDKYDSLVVLDAKTLEEVAIAELPENVKASYTFHGFYSDNKALN
jgi:carotenoid cleavage dioxygenase-like enzyme